MGCKSGNYGLLRLNQSTVELAQGTLQRMGLYDGPIDGCMNKETIIGLQKHLSSEGHDLKIDGIDGKITVTDLQIHLQNRSLYPGKIDAIAGPLTDTGAATYFGEQGTLPAAPKRILSEQVTKVSEIAAQNGDKTYIMVDKVNGKIILFEDGKLVLIAPALTGESLSDIIPSTAFGKTLDQQAGEDKTTPVGRFTVSVADDPHYGKLLQINEVRGDDWTIAVHKVYTGTASEKREQRLASNNPDDKHITYGCINVAEQTIKELIAHVGNNQSTPIYILPQNKAYTAEFFPDQGQIKQRLASVEHALAF